MSKYKSLKAIFISTLTLGLCLGVGQANALDAAGSLSSYVDSPDVQNSYVNGTLMNFDNGCPLVWPGIGTTDVACISKTPDPYGGASTEASVPTTGGTTTNYAWVENFNMTLTLDQPSTYFGLWWSAGNEANYINFYSDDELLGSFSCATLVTALNSQAVSSTDGESHTTADYFGSPVSGNNSGEPYAYLHIFAAEGKTFNKVVLSEAGFEFDNVVVARGANTALTTLVHLDGPLQELLPTEQPTDDLANSGSSSSPWLLTSLALALIAAGVALRSALRRVKPLR
ncbi:MAG: hypothetical protein NTX78_04615 [Rhodoluna sp.]|nr:hypothetical protein [Rhodoluna sp.]